MISCSLHLQSELILQNFKVAQNWKYIYIYKHKNLVSPEFILLWRSCCCNTTSVCATQTHVCNYLCSVPAVWYFPCAVKFSMSSYSLSQYADGWLTISSYQQYVRTVSQIYKLKNERYVVWWEYRRHECKVPHSRHWLHGRKWVAS